MDKMAWIRPGVVVLPGSQDAEGGTEAGAAEGTAPASKFFAPS